MKQKCPFAILDESQTGIPLCAMPTPEGQLLPSCRLPVYGRCRCFDTAYSIGKWQQDPLTETGKNSGRSRKPAKVLRTERAGRSETDHCGIPQWTARRHFGPGEVETEHLSPLKGGAVI